MSLWKFCKLNKLKIGPCRILKEFNAEEYIIHLSDHLTTSNVFSVSTYRGNIPLTCVSECEDDSTSNPFFNHLERPTSIK